MEEPRRGVSLIEALLAVTILGSAATMYGSAWSSTFGANDVARTLELATELYVRECAILRRANPRGVYPAEVPFFERAFQTAGAYRGGCAPPNPGSNESGTTFYQSPATTVGGGADLSYNTPLDKLLDTPGTNCFEIPPGTPGWNPTLPVAADGTSLADLLFSVRVFASRVQESNGGGVPRAAATLNGAPGTESGFWLNQLIRYRVVVLRNNVHVLSGEFLVEVR